MGRGDGEGGWGGGLEVRGNGEGGWGGGMGRGIGGGGMGRDWGGEWGGGMGGGNGEGEWGGGRMCQGRQLSLSEDSEGDPVLREDVSFCLGKYRELMVFLTQNFLTRLVSSSC